MAQLIVNADDFGLTAGVNRAIVELHRAGFLSSATLMAKAAATDEAIQLALATPSLGVGCHVVFVDGEPVLSACHDVPHLADPITGRFHPSLPRFLKNLFRASPAQKLQLAREIESEAAAQIALLQSQGVPLTHIDTHKHTHMFPAVLRPVLRAARAAGIRVVRNPFEPHWSRRATPAAPLLRRAEVGLLRCFEPVFRRIVAEEGFSTTDGALGVLATGTLDAPTFAAIFAAMPQGIFELVTHPGYNDADLARARTRLLASRETEREALASVHWKDGIELIDFSRL